MRSALERAASRHSRSDREMKTPPSATAAVALGGAFLWFALRLQRRADRRSALRAYLYSLAYLALLFCAMVLDTRL